MNDPQQPPQSPYQPLPPQGWQQYPPTQQWPQPPHPQMPSGQWQQMPSGQWGPPPPPKRPTRWPWFVGAAVVLALVIGIESMSGGSKPLNSASAATTSATPRTEVGKYQSAPRSQSQAPTTSAVPAGPATTADDGTYEVGIDIAPGQYKTSGPDPSDIFPNCYFARLKNDSGEFSAIIANGNVQGPGSVTTKAGEFLELRGGCTWTKK